MSVLDATTGRVVRTVDVAHGHIYLLEYHLELAQTRYAFELGLLGLQALRAGVGP